MNKYTMKCSNGWTEVIESKTLRGAKCKATRLATHGGGTFSIMEPNGTVHTRHMWEGFTVWGWYRWSVEE